MGITSKLAEDLYQIRILSDKDVEQLQTLILDYFAAAFAGYRQSREFNRAVEEVVLARGGIEESHILFQQRRYPSGTAAFMNTVYGHGAELDDGNKKAAGHAGVQVIPAVFALADKLDSSNQDVLIALATGYETFIRVASAAQPGMIQRGFHSTGMTGALACAAACARLYHLDARGIENAVALATTMSGGLLSYGDSRPVIKPLNPGKAAESGVFAAMLASEGVEGPEESLEGQNGWFHAVTQQVDESALAASDHLLMHDCYIKLYPSCRHTHCGIEAAIALHGTAEPNEIEAVNIYTYPNAIKLAGIQYPENPDETKFSVPYTFACAYLNGSYRMEDTDPSSQGEVCFGLIDRIHLIPDTSLENKEKGIRGARAEIITKNGKVSEETVLFPKGDPEKPLTREDVVNKLENCSGRKASSSDLRALIEAVCSISGEKTFINPMIYCRNN